MLRDIYDSLSPSDYRYWDEGVARYLSENGFTRYKLKVELALVKALHGRGLCSAQVVLEIEAACAQVTTDEVYIEEEKTHHNIRALVNCIRRRVSDEAKRFVHFPTTSYDTIDTANALRYRDVVLFVLIPRLKRLEKVLTDIVLRDAKKVQVGRTHGQHAVPITFGFAIAEYVSRLGGSIVALGMLAKELHGKSSGAVGAYNASSLFFEDPEVFEQEVLTLLGLTPGEYSTQIVSPEPLIRLLCEMTITAGILANLADDMRHLQRTEISEVGEEFEEGQDGSSTMPHKQNPVNFENTKGCWKIVTPRIVTAFMDQISEHQRDLTNSASARTYPETFNYVASMAKRLIHTMTKLSVNDVSLQRNLSMQRGLIAAEPLYTLLSMLGHPDGHGKSKALTLQARREDRSFGEVVFEDPELQEYFARMTPAQRDILKDPSSYTGIAAAKASAIALRWKEELGL